MTRAETLLHRARAAGVWLATAESCTGGLIAAAITEVPGSSEVFDRGFVTYSNGAKTDMLGVPPASIARCGAVSEEVAIAMAEGALLRSNATLAVAVTGVAGPGGSEQKPEGMVCFCVAQTGRSAVAETMQFGALGRAQVRAATVDYALDLLIGRLS
ncbi:MAG: CinA family protein [Rhodobacter sp.]|nr:CinA family protein [Rhodobacter sp.]